MPAYKYTNRDAGQPSLPKKATSTEVITEWLSEKKTISTRTQGFWMELIFPTIKNNLLQLSE